MGGRKNLQIFFSCGLGLALVHSAAADFVGIVTVIKDDPDTVALCNNAEGDSVPFPLTVCNVLVAFDSHIDRLLGVENADLQVYDVRTPAVFFQHPFGADTAYACLFQEVIFPDLVCDSFVTIKAACTDGNDCTTTDPGFDTAGFNGAGHVGGGWSDPCPPDHEDVPCCPPIPNILFLQASVAQGSTLSGTVDIRWKDADKITVEQGVFIECSFGCDADLDGDGAVNALDLAQLLGNWGPCSVCPADLNSDDVVNAADLATLLGAWGPCG